MGNANRPFLRDMQNYPIYVSIHHSTIEVQWKYEIPREFH
jgi:hypothetical protein